MSTPPKGGFSVLPFYCPGAPAEPFNLAVFAATFKTAGDCELLMIERDDFFNRVRKDLIEGFLTQEESKLDLPH